MNDEQLATREALRALLHGWELRNTQLLARRRRSSSARPILRTLRSLALKQLELVAHERGAERRSSWAAVEAEPEAVFATAPDGTTEQIFNADGSRCSSVPHRDA